MLPVQYEKKHEIVTFDGDIFYVNSDRIAEFHIQMNDNKFIRIGESFIATSTIKIVRPAKTEISILEKLLQGKEEDTKIKVREKVREREKEGYPITQGVISNIIAKYENPGDI